MKRFCLISLLLISVFFLFSVKVANAAPVTFTSTEYWADAYVNSEGESGVGPPLPVAASYSSFPGGSASASTNDGLNFYANAGSSTEPSEEPFAGPEVHSEAYMDSRLEFIADFPVLHVQFDYNLNAGGDSTTYNVYAQVWIGLYNETTDLWDSNDNYTGTDFYTNTNTFNVSGSGWDEDSGSFNQYLSLATPGDTYALYLELSSECNTIGSAGASANLTNLQIEAVPIPGAVWLLGSGLICLVAVRRNFSK